MIDAATVQVNLEGVRRRIEAAGGEPDGVTIVAVTKAFPTAVARAALDAGIVELGENYAQEMLAKVRDLADDPPAVAPRWHFIGRLQTNKVRQLAPHVALWQTIDRIELGREVARHAPGASVLVQVNATAEEQKGGCQPAAVPELVTALGEAGLSVRGLMGVGRDGDEDATRAAFATIVGLADQLALPVRSIGMTGDLEVAVACGSTMVRVGRVLFGERPPR